MGTTNKSIGLFQRLRSRPAPDTADAADMGTCIGLDFSLDQTVDDQPPTPAPGRQAPRWVQRLTSRAKSGR